MKKLRLAVVIVAVVIVLSVVSAFIWPGWAIREQPTPSALESATTSASPTIKATALPDDASDLLKAMPDTVANFARTSAKASETWKSSSPTEEYTLTYSTGDAANDVTVIVGQWSDEDAAAKQYDALQSAASGTTLAAGNIKVDGEKTGSYIVRTNGDDTSKATALWLNGTVVFEATGAAEPVETICEEFPL